MLNSSASFPLTNQDYRPRVAYIMVLFDQKKKSKKENTNKLNTQ